MAVEKIQRVTLHPTSIRAIRKGHPWITEDNWTKKFPRDSEWLIGKDASGKEVALFRHDPLHKVVKGRVWSLHPPFDTEVTHFSKTLLHRLKVAFAKREDAGIARERENYYMVFGEADLLPGLFIQFFGKHILVQTYMEFWNKERSRIQNSLSKLLATTAEGNQQEIWWQDRSGGKTTSEKKPQEFELWEFGIRYLVRLGEQYDTGIFTDMSSIRKQIAPYLKPTTSFLNLYAYTGAFSLFALKQGVEKVLSVDLSKKYLQWLERNLECNPSLEKTKHESWPMPVEKAIGKLKALARSFDFIVCDPPSVLTNGKKRISAMQMYESVLPRLIELTTPGGLLLVMLNTHKIKAKEYRKKILGIIEKNGLSKKVTLEKTYSLGEDCPTIAGFEEGAYLKGILLRIKKR